MKIGIFQDIHANLPAFRKGIEVFRANHCNEIYHVGDLIGIGPYPREVMEFAISTPDLVFIMGNHDHWYGHGLPDPIPDYMNQDEVNHHLWAHNQIGEKHKKTVQEWPFIATKELSNGKSLTFQHYGVNEKINWFKPHIMHPQSHDLDQMFDLNTSEFLFYGHNHLASDIQGKNRYVNLGSAGCFDKPEVRVGILEITGDKVSLEKLSVSYDDNGLMEEYEKRRVPARDFITKTFITRHENH